MRNLRALLLVALATLIIGLAGTPAYAEGEPTHRDCVDSNGHPYSVPADQQCTSSETIPADQAQYICAGSSQPQSTPCDQSTTTSTIPASQAQYICAGSSQPQSTPCPQAATTQAPPALTRPATPTSEKKTWVNDSDVGVVTDETGNADSVATTTSSAPVLDPSSAANVRTKVKAQPEDDASYLGWILVILASLAFVATAVWKTRPNRRRQP